MAFTFKSGVQLTIDPVLFRAGNVGFYWYGLAYTFGFAVLCAWLWLERRHLGWTPRQLCGACITLILAVLAGGRLFEVLVYERDWFAGHMFDIPMLWKGGMATHGLLLGSVAGAAIVAYRTGTPILKLLDVLSVAAAFILGVGRIGNFIEGGVIGTQTEAPWGVHFPGVEGFRHPVALYDGLKNLLLVPALILVLRRWPAGKGVATSCFLIGYGGLRFLVDRYRDYESVLFGMGPGQWFNLAMALIGGALLFATMRSGRTPPACAASLDGRPERPSAASMAVLIGLILFPLCIPNSWTTENLQLKRRASQQDGPTSASASPSVDVPAKAPVDPRDRIKHIIVIILENRSFDQLYGMFPGANGIVQAVNAPPQVDRSGKAYRVLPPVLNTNLIGRDGVAAVDARFPKNLPNRPFRAEAYAALNQTTGDAVHRFYQEQLQINGGAMNKFVAWSDAGSLAMSYYDGSRMPLWDYAKRFTLADNFFHGAFGGSFLNHFFLVCACAPEWKDAPKDMIARLDSHGGLARDGEATPDGYAVNTVEPLRGPHSSSIVDPKRLLPPVKATNIGDRLSEKGVDWAWFAGGWDNAVAGKPDPDFQFHHQVFAFFERTALGSEGAKNHLKDELDFLSDLQNGELPPVVFYKPIGEENEHAGYANISAGENHTATLLRMIERSPIWKDSVVIVTYDENGGMWDHVPPPVVDRWGPGARVPTLIISPFAKKAYVDHTLYDTTSIAKFIEWRFSLAPLGSRDAAANNLTNALELE